MGDRLTIIDENDNQIWYGTKLVGYTHYNNLSCLDYLYSLTPERILSTRILEKYNNRVRGADNFKSLIDSLSEYNENKIVRLSVEELIEFLKYYDVDFKKIYGLDYSVLDNLEIPPDVKFVWLEWG